MSSPRKIPLARIESLARAFFLQEGCSDELSAALAKAIVLAERDGPASHGLAHLWYYQTALRSGTVNLKPQVSIYARRPGVLVVDCHNSFAQPGLERARLSFMERVWDQGIGLLMTQNAHYISALRHDVLPLAEAGLIALMVSGSRPWVVPFGGRDPVFGTNPMAFACPRKGGPPLMWDQGVSISAISEIRLAEKEGKVFDSPVGLDEQGQPSTDPAAIIKGRRLFTYGGHKGTTIALMVEILAAGLTGGRFAVEHEGSGFPTNPAGQVIIAIDPNLAGVHFETHLERLLTAIDGNGAARIPGDGRLERARIAEQDGVEVPDWLAHQLAGLGVAL